MMVWAFLLICALGVILVQLGSYSVWVVVLSLGLKLSLLALAIVAVVYFARLLINGPWFNRAKIIRGKVLKDG